MSLDTLLKSRAVKNRIILADLIRGDRSPRGSLVFNAITPGSKPAW